MKQHCVSWIFIVYSWKATPLQQNLPLHLDYLVLPKRSRNKLMNFSCLINFIFSSTCNYVQLNYNNLNIICPAISISLPTSKTVAPCVSSRTPLKNGANVGKSYVWPLKGTPKKDVSINRLEKSRCRVKKFFSSISIHFRLPKLSRRAFLQERI